MKKNKRNPTTIELVAKKFKVTPSYVRCILKVGRVKPLNFRRMKKDRIALYVAHSDAVKEEKGDVPDVPEVFPIMYYHTATRTATEMMYLESSIGENTDNTSVTEVSNDEPVVTSTLDNDISLTVDSPQVDQPDQLLTRIDVDTIHFKCPCGCEQEFIINHKTLSYE